MEINLDHKKERTKADYIDKIMDSVIQLEVRQGHLQWRMSDLARQSGVTRSLLYYYFGKDTEKILKQAVHYYISIFLDFHLERTQKIKQGEIVALIAQARKRLMQRPYLLQFYFQHRFEKSEVSHLFEKAENQYFRNLKESLPRKWQPFSRVLWAFVFGLAIQPSFSEEELKTAEKIMRRAWPQQKK